MSVLLPRYSATHSGLWFTALAPGLWDMGYKLWARGRWAAQRPEKCKTPILIIKTNNKTTSHVSLTQLLVQQ